MTFVSLPSLVLLAVGLLAALFLLPGLVLKVVAFIRRLRGRRAESPAILGPLFWHELVTVTRRGTQVRLRMGYTILLLGGLIIAFLSQFREENPIRLLLYGGEFPRERVTAFATTFFQIFLFCQLLALTLVTPVFAGGSIIEEKDRGTIAFLQTSLLSNREIVLGKIAARVLFILGLALAGLPVLALSLLFGGVDPIVLTTSFISDVFSTVSLAAYSFWQATRQNSLKAVLVNAYLFAGALFLLSGCCASCFDWKNLITISPFALLLLSVNPGNSSTIDPVELTMVSIGIHGFLALIFAVLGMGNIRAIILRNPAPLRRVSSGALPEGARWVEIPGDRDRPALPPENGYRRERPPPRFVRVPPIDDEQPFLWKERYFGGKLPSFEADALRGCGLALLVATILPTVFGVFVASASTDRPQEVIHPIFQIASIALIAFGVPLAGARAVGCVASERQRQTLDSLFAIPEDRRIFLEVKARVALEWLRYWLMGYGLFATIALLTLTIGLGALAVMIPALFVALLFHIVLAVWLSVRCAAPSRGMAWYLTIVGMLYLAPPMFAVLAGGAAELLGIAPGFVAAIVESLSLPFGVYTISAGHANYPETWSGAVVGTLVSAAILVLSSAVLWRAAVRRFETEGK